MYLHLKTFAVHMATATCKLNVHLPVPNSTLGPIILDPTSKNSHSNSKSHAVAPTTLMDICLVLPHDAPTF